MLFGIALTGFQIGYGNGKDTNDSLANFLEKQNSEIEKAAAQLRLEVSALKLQLQEANSPTVATPSTAPTSVSTPTASNPASNINVENLNLRAGETAQAFGGKLSISLVATKFEGSPLRYKAIATIGSPGKQNKSLDLVDVGFATVFDGYEVRVVGTNTFSSSFSITKLSD